MPRSDADHRREAGERGEADEGGKRRALLRRHQRGGDADALGDVVDDEADDQEGRQRRGAGGERRADREALAEIVEADAEGDEEGEAHALRRLAAAPADRQQADGGQAHGDPDDGRAAQPVERLGAGFEALGRACRRTG